MLNKEYFNEEGIKKIIDQKIEESIIIEYKRSGSLERNPRKIDEISKDVSAFANSSGGIIIYGIEEENHVPKGYSFIDGNEFTKEWLENIIDSNIFPKIQELIIHPIRFNNEILKSIYVIEIPKSKSSPHMANKGNRYYRRYNFKSVPLEEYEVRNLYFKSEQTVLKIDETISAGGSSSSQNNKLVRAKFNISFQIKNIGNTIEELYKLEINVPNNLISFSNSSNSLEKFIVRRESDYIVYSVPNNSPIFQDELTTVFTIPIEITEHTKIHLNEFEIDLKLYYTCGIDEKRIYLKDILFYKDHPLTLDDFRY
jgi:hypothetical protein